MIDADIGSDVPIPEILNFVLVDTENCNYCVPIDKDEITALGIVIIDLQLVDDDSLSLEGKSDFLDPTKITEVLLTLGS